MPYNLHMSAQLLATKLFIPHPREQMVARPHLSKTLEHGQHRKLTILSAPAGFGKTTLLAEWCQQSQAPVAWLSLEQGDNDAARFLSYLIAALQTIVPELGKGVRAALQAPQPPPFDVLLTTLVNEIALLDTDIVLVLDDYHVLDAKPIDDALTFLIEHIPPRMHLVIATRQDPSFSLAQLRARDELAELRAADLRFTFSEASEFLNQVMGLNLTAHEIEQLETRTEGWAAGLQLAALSMRGLEDTASFIQSFTGSHRFVLDYLLEQVLQKQSEDIQTFLLCTSILDRMCGPLCDMVLDVPAGSGRHMLSELERANLFIFPLDNAREWYRYHHLWRDLLRQRLGQTDMHAAVLHQRASAWYENNDLIMEAFQHATAANDIARAERLLESGQIPFHFPGAVHMILDWLNSLPQAVLEAHPVLAARAGSLLLVIGITTGVEEKLDTAENALRDAAPNDGTRNLLGEIASARATLALTRYQLDTVVAQAQRALEFLRPDNFAFGTYACWAQGVAYFIQGDRAAAQRALSQALALAQASGNPFAILLVLINLGALQEGDNQLDTALEMYRRALQLAGEPALSIAYEAHLGMARIFYERNDLDAAQHHGEIGLELARQYDRVIDRYIVCEVFLARVQLARGDTDGAVTQLAHIEQTARANNFLMRLPEIAATQIPALVRQKNLAAAAQLAQTYNLPLGQARVLLAQGDADAALRVLETFGQLTKEKNWVDERLSTMVIQTLALRAQDRLDFLQVLDEALRLAKPSGMIRLFVDLGEPMRALLSDFKKRVRNPSLENYVNEILAAFASPSAALTKSNAAAALVEPLTQRELEILQLIAQGYSNQEIGKRLFLALSTVKGYNRTLFDKLQVKNRTEAVARARAFGLF